MSRPIAASIAAPRKSRSTWRFTAKSCASFPPSWRRSAFSPWPFRPSPPEARACASSSTSSRSNNSRPMDRRGPGRNNAAMVESPYLVAPGKKFKISDCPTDETGKFKSKKDVHQPIQENLKKLHQLQDLLYAQAKYAVM